MPLITAIFDGVSASGIVAVVLCVLGASLAIGVLLVRVIRRQQAMSSQPRLTPHEEINRSEDRKAVRNELEDLAREIERMTAGVSVEIDRCSGRLETLIAQADRRIAELKRLQGGQTAIEEKPSPGMAQMLDPPVKMDLPSDPMSQKVYLLADRGMDAPAIAARLKEHVGKVELILALRKV